MPDKPPLREVWNLNTPYELFGTEVGKGWHGIIKPLIDHCNSKGIQITQIKEKFGTLRFYVGPADDETFDMIDAAELASETTCEDCGQPGTLRTNGWWRTLCDNCESQCGNI